jgi:hypothetical protein
MQTLRYTIGCWRAEAQLEEVDAGKKLMAIIHVTGGKEGAGGGDSKHTVVFEHQDGADKRTETEVWVHRLLQERYGL